MQLISRVFVPGFFVFWVIVGVGFQVVKARMEKVPNENVMAFELTSLSKISETSSVSVFTEAVRKAEKPIVIRGLVKDWPLVKAGNESVLTLLDYLAGNAKSGPIRFLEAPDGSNGYFFYNDRLDGFNFERRQTTFKGFVDRLINHLGRKQAPVLSIQSAYVDEYFDKVGDENRMDVLGEAVRARIWIGNATRVATHNDDAENIACVAAGRRRFVLFPPEQLSNLYVGPLEVTPAGAPVSLASLIDPDFDRYPKLKDALGAGSFSELEPGDAIYIPTLWWHHVEGLEAVNVLVNYWKGGAVGGEAKPGGFDTLLMAMLALRPLPLQQRKAWQAWFDHYVFNGNNDEIEHIPPAMRGILDELKPDRRKQIKQWLIKQLSD